jgi:aryl-alcohol dehydrogenase-like predicted oxidoreductase
MTRRLCHLLHLNSDFKISSLGFGTAKVGNSDKEKEEESHLFIMFTPK